MSKYAVEIGGFTIAPDAIVIEHGFMTAGVYGIIWRYERMADGVCKAAATTLSDMLRINQETLRIHIQKLIDTEYIIDLTPGLRNRPHVYKTTNKLMLSLSVAENPRPNSEQVAENPRVSRGKSASESRKIRDESDSLIDSLIDNPPLLEQHVENPRPNAFAVYEQNIGALTPMIAEAVQDAVTDYTEQWVSEAISEACLNNARNWRYVEAILKRWKVDGFKSQKKRQGGVKSNTSASKAPVPPERY